MSAHHLLFVDGEGATGTVLAAALAEQGCWMSRTGDVANVVAIAEGGHFGGVLLDVQALGMDVFPLCEALLHRRPDRPVLLVSELATVELTVRALRAGASDFLLRPLSAEAVLTALGRLHAEAAVAPESLEPMDSVERKHILRVLQATRGNKTLAARTLGFDRSTLYRKLELYGLERMAPRSA